MTDESRKREREEVEEVKERQLVKRSASKSVLRKKYDCQHCTLCKGICEWLCNKVGEDVAGMIVAYLYDVVDDVFPATQFAVTRLVMGMLVDTALYYYNDRDRTKIEYLPGDSLVYIWKGLDINHDMTYSHCMEMRKDVDGVLGHHFWLARDNRLETIRVTSESRWVPWHWELENAIESYLAESSAWEKGMPNRKHLKYRVKVPGIRLTLQPWGRRDESDSRVVFSKSCDPIAFYPAKEMMLQLSRGCSQFERSVFELLGAGYPRWKYFTLRYWDPLEVARPPEYTPYWRRPKRYKHCAMQIRSRWARLYEHNGRGEEDFQEDGQLGGKWKCHMDVDLRRRWGSCTKHGTNKC